MNLEIFRTLAAKLLTEGHNYEHLQTIIVEEYIEMLTIRDEIGRHDAFEDIEYEGPEEGD